MKSFKTFNNQISSLVENRNKNSQTLRNLRLAKKSVEMMANPTSIPQPAPSLLQRGNLSEPSTPYHRIGYPPETSKKTFNFGPSGKPATKVTTPKSSGGLLSTRSVPTMKDLGAAPKPEWGPDAAKPSYRGKGARQKNLRPDGVAPKPEWGSKPTIKPTSAPKATGMVKNVLKNLKGLKGGVASLALDTALQPVTDKVAEVGGKALARGIISATGKKNLYPQLYGKQGPNLGIDVVKGIQKREAQAKNSKNVAPGTRIKEIGQKSSIPSEGDRKTWSTGKSETDKKPIESKPIETKVKAEIKTKTKPTGPITSAQAIAMGSKEGSGPKSTISTYRDVSDKGGTSIGRFKTLAQHRAEVARRKAKNNK